MNKLNFKHFKKLHSNEDTTTFKHKDGHEIKIAHSRISPEFKQQLQSMPKFFSGGDIEETNTRKTPTKDEFPDYIGNLKKGLGLQPDEPQQANQEKKKQSRMPASNYAEGGEISDAQIPDYLVPNSEQSSEAAAPTANLDFNMNQAVADVPADASALTNLANQPANINLGQPTAPAGQQPSMLPPSDITAPLKEAVAKQTSGIQAEAAAQGALGNQQADIYQQQAKHAQQMQVDFERKYAELNQERQNIRDDIAASHIDPNRYLNKMSDSGKISTAIGLVLGGISGGLLHQENPALKFINNQIEHDVQAQVQDMGNKKNLLAAVHEQFGNLKDATNMVRATYADLYSNKIAEAAAKSTDPLVKARAEQAIGKLQESVAPQLMDTARRQMLFEGVGNKRILPEQAVEGLVPKEHQKQVFTEIANAQHATQNEKEIMTAFDDASKENTLLRTGAGLLRTPGSIQKMNAMFLPMIHDQEGRVNEYEQHTLQELMPKPGDMDAKIAYKRQALEAFINNKKSAPTAKGYGIDLSRSVGTNRPGTPRRNDKAGY